MASNGIALYAFGVRISIFYSLLTKFTYRQYRQRCPFQGSSLSSGLLCRTAVTSWRVVSIRSTLVVICVVCWLDFLHFFHFSLLLFWWISMSSQSPPPLSITPRKTLLHAPLPWWYEKETPEMAAFQCQLCPFIQILGVLEGLWYKKFLCQAQITKWKKWKKSS